MGEGERKREREGGKEKEERGRDKALPPAGSLPKYLLPVLGQLQPGL